MPRFALHAARFGVVVLACSSLCAATWPQIPPEELAAAPTDPDARSSVEVLLKTIELDNSNVQYGATQKIHVRLKVFDPRGVDELTHLGVNYPDGVSLSDVAARVVRPDGTSAEVPSMAFFDNEIVRSSRVRMRRRSFSPSPVAPGDIVEYRAMFSSTGVSLSFSFLLQERWPVRLARIRFKPIAYPGVAMRSVSYLIEREEKGADANGFHTFEVRNLPARREEPFSPPDSMIAPWVMIRQIVPGDPPDEHFWQHRANRLAKEGAAKIKPRPPVVAKAKELTAGVTDADARLSRLYTFCQEAIRSTAYDFEGAISAKERERIKGSDRADEILARGVGNPHNVRILFASLASAAGFEARLALVNDRSEILFAPKLTDPTALPDEVVAVRVGEDWRFFDPGSRYLDFGSLRWENEGVQALVAGNDKPEFAKTAAPRAELARELRRGQLALDADGTLHGDIALEFSGHRGLELKEKLDDASARDREKELEKRVQQMIPTAELTDIAIDGVTSIGSTVRFTARLRAPGFAERAGDRLFVQPGVFGRGRAPVFTAAERVHDLHFRHPWSERDEVRIALPEGFELEQASAPRSIDSMPFLKYNVGVSVTKARPATLFYERDFVCRGFVVPARHYAAAKAILDEVLRQDQHTLTAKRSSS